MISEIMQSANTRMWSGPIRLFSSTSPMLIVLAAGWVIVRSQAAYRRPLRVPYQTLLNPNPRSILARRSTRRVTAVFSESSSDEIPGATPNSQVPTPNEDAIGDWPVGSWKLHRLSDDERTRCCAGRPLRRVDPGTRRRQRGQSRARRLGGHSDERGR